MSNSNDSLSVSLFAELLVVDQMFRSRVSKALPTGMELSHFSVLHHLAVSSDERTPAQIASTFKLTRGAMSNTLNKLEWMGYIHVRPDWDDARRKLVTISPSGVSARDAALAKMQPLMNDIVEGIEPDRIKSMIPSLRAMRLNLSEMS